MEESKKLDDNSFFGSHEASFPSVIEHISLAFRYTTQRLDLIGWILASIVGLFVLLIAAIFMGANISHVYGGSGMVVAITLLLGALILLVGFFVIFSAAMYIAVHRSEKVHFFAGCKWVLQHILPLSIVGLWVQFLNVCLFFAPLMAATAALSFIDSTAFAVKVSPHIAVIIWLTLSVLSVVTVLVSVYFSFSLFVYMKDHYSGVDALLRSTDLVCGSYWKIIWRLVIVIVPVTVFFSVLNILLTNLAESSDAAEVVTVLFINILGIVFMVYSFFYMAILLDALVGRKQVFAVSSYKKLRTLYWIAIIFGPILLVLFIGMIASSATSSSIASSNGDNFEDVLLEDIHTGVGALPEKSLSLRADTDVTMFDVWSEIDWFYYTNDRYPGTIEDTLDLPYIPENIKYEVKGDGEGFQLCRKIAAEEMECVTEEDVNYPYPD